jgi:epsilon-lactone hydrolase
MLMPAKPRAHLLFVVLTLISFIPILFCLSMLRADWYGWATAVFCFGLLFYLRGRPFWHGWRSALCFAGVYIVALFGLYAARPATDVSFLSQIGNGVVRTFVGLPKEDQARGFALLTDTGWTAPEGYTLEIVLLENDVRLELLTKDGSESHEAILQLHGGAFVSGLNDMYREFALRYSKLFGDCLVATLDYRLSPANPYPAQQQDTLAAWRYLTQTLSYSAANIVVAGDSAGGNLTLSLGLRLRDAGEPLPAGLVCMSPWGDLSNSGASHITNATLDPSFGIPESEFHGQAIGVDSTYADGLDATDPYLSPSFGDYAGFPPMLIQVGSIEILLSDCEMVYENAKSHGVDCQLTVYKDMFHVFQGTLDLLPESRLAWEEVGTFLTARLSALTQ